MINVLMQDSDPEIIEAINNIIYDAAAIFDGSEFVGVQTEYENFARSHQEFTKLQPKFNLQKALNFWEDPPYRHLYQSLLPNAKEIVARAIDDGWEPIEDVDRELIDWEPIDFDLNDDDKAERLARVELSEFADAAMNRMSSWIVSELEELLEHLLDDFTHCLEANPLMLAACTIVASETESLTESLDFLKTHFPINS